MSINTPAEAAAKLRVLALRVATPFTANPETSAAITSGAAILRALLSTAAPHKTGAYAETISTYSTITTDVAWIGGEGARPLTGWLIAGTRAHDIYPMLNVMKSKNYKKAIRSYKGGGESIGRFALFWPGADHPVAHVHHPGTKPNPWHEKPSETAAGIISDSVANAMVRSLANAI